jgi:hypothetical protein
MHLMRLTILTLIIVGASLSPRSEAGSICLSTSDGCSSGAPSAPVTSTGADGTFQALTNSTLVAGTYNFTDVLIGANATLSFISTGAPQDIYLLSTSDVAIYGNIIANGDNLYIGAANNFSLVGTGTIDVTGGTVTIDSGATATINGSIITGTTNNNSGSSPPLLGGGSNNLAAVPVPPSLFLLLSGLPLLIRRRSR